jgi:hypothetical protein
MQESDNIQVLVRVRPPNTKEQADGFTRGVDKASDGTVLVKAGAGPAKPYAFDHVVDHTDSQQTLFESVGKPIAESCLQGYHGCLLAYGQTGAGKTFTMQVRSRASRVRVRVVGAKVQPLVNHPSLTPTPRREPLVLSQRFTLRIEARSAPREVSQNSHVALPLAAQGPAAETDDAVNDWANLGAQQGYAPPPHLVGERRRVLSHDTTPLWALTQPIMELGGLCMPTPCARRLPAAPSHLTLGGKVHSHQPLTIASLSR